MRVAEAPGLPCSAPGCLPAPPYCPEAVVSPLRAGAVHAVLRRLTRHAQNAVDTKLIRPENEVFTGVCVCLVCSAIFYKVFLAPEVGCSFKLSVMLYRKVGIVPVPFLEPLSHIALMNVLPESQTVPVTMSRFSTVWDAVHIF
eukprot:1146110-Pelagomonas_calceolata.AAC.6